MYLVLDQENMGSGVAFAITKRHLLTAAHNVSAESAEDGVIRFDETVALRKPGTKQKLDAVCVGGSIKKDWAVLELRTEGVSLAPAVIVDEGFSFTTSTRVQLFTLHVALANETDREPRVRFCAPTTVEMFVGNDYEYVLFDRSTFAGDSGSPLVDWASGRVCGMHVYEFNQLPAPANPPDSETKDFVDMDDEDSRDNFESCNRRRADNVKGLAKTVSVKNMWQQGQLKKVPVTVLRDFLRAKGVNAKGPLHAVRKRVADMLEGEKDDSVSPPSKRPRPADSVSLSRSSGNGSNAAALQLSTIFSQVKQLCRGQELVLKFN